MLSRAPLRGFTTIELAVTLVVMSLLMIIAIPSFGSWLADSRIRSTAESMQNGLRMALAEAMRRNRVSVFALTRNAPGTAAPLAPNGPNWLVGLLPLANTDEVGTGALQYVQGSSYGTQAAVTVQGPAVLCFGPLGQQVPLDSASNGLSADCSSDNPTVYTVAAAGGDRPLQLQVYLGGRVRLCDPAKTLSEENPDGC